MIRSLWDSYNTKGYGAMPLRGHSAALRAEPATRFHRLRAAAVIAGEGLVIFILIFLIPALFAGA